MKEGHGERETGRGRHGDGEMGRWWGWMVGVLVGLLVGAVAIVLLVGAACVMVTVGVVKLLALLVLAL